MPRYHLAILPPYVAAVYILFMVKGVLWCDGVGAYVSPTAQEEMVKGAAATSVSTYPHMQAILNPQVAPADTYPVDHTDMLDTGKRLTNTS